MGCVSPGAGVRAMMCPLLHLSPVASTLAENAMALFLLNLEPNLEFADQPFRKQVQRPPSHWERVGKPDKLLECLLFSCAYVCFLGIRPGTQGGGACAAATLF